LRGRLARHTQPSGWAGLLRACLPSAALPPAALLSFTPAPQGRHALALPAWRLRLTWTSDLAFSTWTRRGAERAWRLPQPDNWKAAGSGGVDFVGAWIAAHIAAATALGKPLLIEEFGKIVTQDSAAADASERNPYYSAVYKARPTLP